MQISIPQFQVRGALSDCVHEQVAKRIANVRFTVLNSGVFFSGGIG